MHYNKEKISNDRIIPQNAVVLLQREFSRFAVNLRRHDLSLQDDLVQEMSLGVLQCKEPHTLSFFRSRGLSRAKDFLRMWQRRAMLNFDDLHACPASAMNIDPEILEVCLERISAILGMDVSELRNYYNTTRTCA